MQKIIAYIDGASIGNPGPAGAGVFLQAVDGHYSEQISVPLGKRTNNYAEYSALLIALEKAINMGAKEIEIRSDSMLVVQQMNGNYKIKSKNIVGLAMKACNLLAKFKSYSLIYIPRESNWMADRLASSAAKENDNK